MRSLCRSQPETQAANKGAPTHVHSAEVEINWPAVATDTFSALLISFKMPVTIITPVPITMLPNIKGQSTRGNGVFNGGPDCS